MSTYFKCILGTPRNLEVSEVVWEFGSKSRTGAWSRESGLLRSSRKKDLQIDRGFWKCGTEVSWGVKNGVK